MGYLKDAANQVKYIVPFAFRDQPEPTWADTLRFARDSFHNGALLLAGAGIGVEAVGSGPIAHAWALGLGCLAVASEGGAFMNNQDLQRELAHNELVQASTA